MRFSNRGSSGGSAREKRVFIKVSVVTKGLTDRIFRAGGRGRGELINSNKSLMRRDDLSRLRKGKVVLARKSDKDECGYIYIELVYVIFIFNAFL